MPTFFAAPILYIQSPNRFSVATSQTSQLRSIGERLVLEKEWQLDRLLPQGYISDVEVLLIQPYIDLARVGLPAFLDRPIF